MKKNIWITCLFLLVASASFAQTQPAPRELKTAQERADNQTKRLSKSLTLTPEQTPQVQAANLEHAQKIDEIRAKYKGQKEKAGMMDEVRAAEDARDAKMKVTLTPEQYTKYEAVREKQQEKVQEKMQNRHRKH
jgi:periplasmic protein CpxP/Spy